eukprot:gene14916-16458_t
MLCREGRVALVSFMIFAVLVLYYLSDIKFYLHAKSSWKFPCLGFLSAAGLTFFMPHPDVARRSAFIGTVLGCGCVVALLSIAWRPLGFYMIALAFFHLSEYILTALYNEDTLNCDSFILNHSLEYQVAVLSSISEFCIEMLLFPAMKLNWLSRLLFVIGILVVIGGEACRKLAMITAKSNFSHIVQSRKIRGHQLVTDGVYQISRHPSYFGWFYWSIGTQVMLFNPICAIGFAVASWKFFHERIRNEEFLLIKFFGDEYIKYIKNVPTRIPFINGLEQEVKDLKF